MIINGTKSLFIHCFTCTQHTYVSPTDYDYTVIYEMTNKTVSLLNVRFLNNPPMHGSKIVTW